MTEVRIVEATGRAGGTGVNLSTLIIVAQLNAQAAMNNKGIADDTKRDRLVELLGEDEVARHEALNVAEEITREVDGSDVIRHAKNEARVQAKAEYNAGAREAREAADLHAAREDADKAD